MTDALDKLTIKGFKSIREMTEFELNSLNVFIGGNGAGKSNLVDFFRMMRHKMDGNLQKHIHNGGGISDFLFEGRKITPFMSFEMRFGAKGYRFRLAPGPLEDVFIEKEEYFIENKWNPLPKFANTEAVQSLQKAIRSWQVYHFHDTGATAGMRNAEIVQDNQRLRFDAANIAAYLLRLQNEFPTNYQEILSAIRLVMPFFDDFALIPRKFGPKEKVALEWRQRGSDYPYQPYQLSDGSIRFICLATCLLQPEPPSTVIIDEPELGLHPSAIGILAELIRDAAQRTQLMIATQSPLLIDHFGIDEVVAVNREAGASTFTRLDANDFGVWLEDYSVGELWRKNVIAGGPVHE